MKDELTKFAGEIPKLDPQELPNGYAARAYNCDLSDGTIRAFAMPLKVTAIDVVNSAKGLFKWIANSTDYWIASSDVRHYAQSPISGDPYERLYFTASGQLRFFANDNISDPFDPESDYIIAGIPAPTAAPSVSSSGGGTTYRAYEFAWLNRYGDEGPPSPWAAISNYSSGNVTLSGIPSAPSGRAINRVRIYRTNSSASESAEFQYVMDAYLFVDTNDYAVGVWVIYGGELYKCTTLHPAGSWNAAHFTAGDDVDDANLLSYFPSVNFDPPPSGATNLVALAYGSFALFVGNTVYISEVFHPHAYPTDYLYPVDINIVGMASSYNMLVVGGNGKPYILFGSSPSSMSRLQSAEVIPLLNILGICPGQTVTAISATSTSTPNMMTSAGVFMVSKYAIWFCDGNTFTNITERLLKPSDIKSYNTDNLQLYFYEKKLFVFDTVAKRGFFIDFTTDQYWMIELSIFAYSAFYSPDGKFYMIMIDDALIDEDNPPADTPLAIKEWDGSTVDFLKYTWRSGTRLVDFPINLSAVLIMLDQAFYAQVNSLIDTSSLNASIYSQCGEETSIGVQGPIGGGFAIAGDSLYTLGSFSVSPIMNFKLYMDGVLQIDRNISSIRNIFRLKGKITINSSYYYEISGYAPCKRVSLAPSMDEV